MLIYINLLSRPQSDVTSIHVKSYAVNNRECLKCGVEKVGSKNSTVIEHDDTDRNFSTFSVLLTTNNKSRYFCSRVDFVGQLVLKNKLCKTIRLK